MSGLLRALAPIVRATALATQTAAADSAELARPLGHRLSGPLWTWIAPIGIFLVAAWATVALYLHFARRTG